MALASAYDEGHRARQNEGAFAGDDGKGASVVNLIEPASET